MQNPHIQISIQSKRFLTPGFAVLFGLGGFALIGKTIALIGQVIFDEQITLSAGHSIIVVLAGWPAVAILFYQVRETSTLHVALRRMERLYSIFGATFFRTFNDMSKWTWIQPKTAYIGSRKFVIDAGNVAEKNKKHLIEMPPKATWAETLALGKMIADHLSIECKSYEDRITGVSSSNANAI